jgi:hypothetical protein
MESSMEVVVAEYTSLGRRGEEDLKSISKVN